MYTQCPECLTAFRVTATLLQQASGRVRCGSCGHAFSAVEHLSEEPPPVEQPTADPGQEADPDALLDTFTDLSGFDDIRIEDTGVEWRVVDEDEDEPAGNDDVRSMRWLIQGQDEEAPAGRIDALPEVHDEVPPVDGPFVEADGGGILVEESAIREPRTSTGQKPGPTGRQSELRYDDNTPLPEDFDEQVASPAEPEGTGRRESDHIEPRSPEFEERQADLELCEPDDWRELLDEFGRDAEAGAAAADHHPGGSETEAAVEATSDVPADIDTQFNLQAIEMGIDVTGNRAVLPDEAAPSDFEHGFADGVVDLELEADTEVPDDRLDFDTGATAPPGVDFDPGDPGASDGIDFGFPEGGDAAEKDEREQRAREVALEAELEAAFTAEAEAETPTDQEVPPQTEEERTINMQIDQDLMRLAQEDGFSATLTGERRMPEDLLVETIVMEGDFVKTALDRELDAVVETVGGADDDPRLLLDTYIKSKEQPIRGGRRRTDPPSYAVIAGVVALGMMLLAQVVHAYREVLATNGAFDQTVGALYRLFGDPLLPHWDARGWRFESTSGSTDAADEVLTIRSRVSNQSGGALPYPLLHVALTDRFEEVIGSRVLEPADYLVEDTATSGPVAAGEEFSATITVESVSADATGFKLNVCYREDASRLRCATEDFRN